MKLHTRLREVEAELDGLENVFASRHGEELRSPAPPPRVEEVPPDVLLVGLVGGTGVGKSTLVNALAGRDLSATSSRRPTTDRVVPYLHRSRLELLDRLEFIRPHLSTDIRPHDVDGLADIVVFDLPDIDSSDEGHARVVEKALEGLDIVLWVTSLTKYSDRLFHDWIARHARGRDVGNFIFFLNKIDELDARDGSEAANDVTGKLREAVLESTQTAAAIGEPLFFTGSAREPDAKIPGNRLRELQTELFRERDAREIERIKSSDRIALAKHRLDHLARVLDLDARHERLVGDLETEGERLRETAGTEELRREFADRLERSSAAEDASRPVFRRMLASWPLLPWLSVLTLPIRQLGRLARLPRLLLTDDEEHAAEVLPLLRASIARLDLERRGRESLRLDGADLERPPVEKEEIARFATELENEAVAQVRARARAEIEAAPPSSRRARALRHFLIWMPLLWFPLMQPLLEEILDPDSATGSIPLRLGHKITVILGAPHLLVSLLFVIAVYLVYLLFLKAAARRRALACCRRLGDEDWWREVFHERLCELFLGDARQRLQSIESERKAIEELRGEIGEIESALG